MLSRVSPLLTTCTAGGGRRDRDWLAGGRRQGRRGGGLARNDQLLAGRQRARALVAIGLQDRGGRNVVAARQSSSVSLVPTMMVVPPCAAALWAAAAERGGTVPVVSSFGWAGGGDRTPGPARLRTHRHSRPDRTAAPKRPAAEGLRTGKAIAALHIAAVRGARPGAKALPPPSRWPRAQGKGIVGIGILREARRHVGAAAGKTNRHQRQHRDLRHATRAKQLDDTGHGYSLVRNKLLF